MLTVSRVTSADSLLALREDWNRLAAAVPFRSFAWHASWWKHYGTADRQLYVLVARDEAERPVGIAPWFLAGSGVNGRTIAWLGSGEVCSDYQSILAEPEHVDAVTEAYAQWLADAADDPQHAWDLMHLDSTPAGDVAVGRLIEHLWSDGSTVHREAGPNCWRISMPATWEEYVASLSKSHRKQVRRVERRQFDSGRTTFHTVNNQQQLERGMEILVDLHQRRRLSLDEPGCFASLPFSGFLHDAAQALLVDGQLRLAWVELEGKPAAAEFQLSGGGVTYAYQAGVDPELLDDEPGRAINIATIRRAIEEGQTAFDFLRGDEPYKAHWRAEPHSTTTYRIVPRRALSQVRHGLWLAGDNVKNWVKTGMELTGMK